MVQSLTLRRLQDNFSHTRVLLLYKIEEYSAISFFDNDLIRF